MHSDLSCAWSGAFLETGAMAATVWSEFIQQSPLPRALLSSCRADRQNVPVLLRSLWTNLRVCWDVHHTSMNVLFAHALGWGIPALFLTISLSVTGVSYRLGATCVPNPDGAIATWFGWLIGFAVAGALIQLATSGFCLFVYARNLLRHESQQQATTTQTSVSNEANSEAGQKSNGAPTIGKRLAWRRVRKLMLIQWRSIVLSVLVIVQAAYFGTVYVALTRLQSNNEAEGRTAESEQWSTCLVLNGGNKEACLQYANALGIDESVVVASMFMASVSPHR